MSSHLLPTAGTLLPTYTTFHTLPPSRGSLLNYLTPFSVSQGLSMPSAHFPSYSLLPPCHFRPLPFFILTSLPPCSHVFTLPPTHPTYITLLIFILLFQFNLYYILPFYPLIQFYTNFYHSYYFITYKYNLIRPACVLLFCPGVSADD